MKTSKLLLLAVLAFAGLGSAWAHPPHRHSGVHFGLVIGPVWPSWYYPPVYYPPRYVFPQTVVIEQPQPQIYIEQPQVAAVPAPVVPATPAPIPAPIQAPVPAPAAPAANPAANNYWYYCAATATYYPYVRECAAGWQLVSPQPPAKP